MSVKSSITGRFVKAADALLNPDETYTIKKPRPSAGKVPCPSCKGRGYLYPDQEVDLSYPYEDGDVTVLGPGIFVATSDKGRSTINWQGVNYMPVDEPVEMP